MNAQELKDKIKAFERVIADNQNNPKMVKKAEEKIAQFKVELAKIEGHLPSSTPEPSAPEPTVPPTDSNELDKALDLLDKAIDQMAEHPKGGKIDEEELKKMIANMKIRYSNLGDDVLELINRSVKIKFEPIPNLEIELDEEPSEILQLVISDLEAKNNVYLYGGAGTGKTFTANQVAKALNCTMITINCNQYTSPLEIIGGQTIDGYQEGKLITAWANLKSDAEGVKQGMKDGTSGVLLLLDELPKIDPNTAGLLNDALAKIKDAGERSEIMNARGQSFEKARFFCIATGNSKLNEESADYVANFRQDLSLQDRFAGSTYELFVDLNVEMRVMNGYLFLFNYLNKLRELINGQEGKQKQLGSKAFVSIRIMLSLRDNWINWYMKHKERSGVKTLQQGVLSFFDLFTPSQSEWLREKSDMKGFFKKIEKQAYDELGYDSPEDIAIAKEYLAEYNRKVANRNKGM